MNVALIMGRGGSKSIHGKNVVPVLDRPLVAYPLLAALNAEKIDRVCVTTDCEKIQEVAQEMGIEVIERPPEISHDTSQMVDGILHALSVLGEDVEFLVTMHANCPTHRAGLIDDCLRRLEQDETADACVSGVIDRSVHPFRTRRLTSGGLLEPWASIPSDVSSNRQSLEPCVILDGAARSMRVAKCFPPHGNAPFPYLGERILMEENEGGFDVHDDDDLGRAERYLIQRGWTQESLPGDYKLSTAQS